MRRLLATAVYLVRQQESNARLTIRCHATSLSRHQLVAPNTHCQLPAKTVLENIGQGYDCRTMVMVRNTPNKLDADTCLRINRNILSITAEWNSDECRLAIITLNSAQVELLRKNGQCKSGA